ncbi:MAG: Peptide methionine sulfoxide reductase MsrB [Acidimicrobiaceae bacterium]|jgi:peptide-methionine (R)-S-oxide reductase|nr:peptide-methionine (R)-S-oxide reductase [Acidimicrobiaceae bacterium]CAI8352921.1 MAG: Peptide methionine sulfoxide reductase MsrB [Acidimicrobiaceae bacterium]|tara:strand:- start:2957 stop:3367 length:411 start_codon:yes stop_codon:yes gene_type:complete
MSSKPSVDKNSSNKALLKERLSDMAFHCTQESGTEPAFTGIYTDEKTQGTYKCIVCEVDLFHSAEKYDSGSGWPSFWNPIDEKSVDTKIDNSYGMQRIEVTCASCGAHLGHVFPDGPQPTGQRFCINSACLQLMPE